MNSKNIVRISKNIFKVPQINRFWFPKNRKIFRKI
jgi:hypothetical protein